MTALSEYLLALNSESLLNLGQQLRVEIHGHTLSFIFHESILLCYFFTGCLYETFKHYFTKQWLSFSLPKVSKSPNH